jgi:ATP dependent DNA ligase C terminal region
VHWVRPELVAEVKYLAWTEDKLLRKVACEGLREDKKGAEVRRPVPHPKAIAPTIRLRARNLHGPGGKQPLLLLRTEPGSFERTTALASLENVSRAMATCLARQSRPVRRPRRARQVLPIRPPFAAGSLCYFA